MDVEALCREIGKSLRDIGLLFLRFFRLDAEGFERLCQGGSARDSAVLTLRLAAFAFVVSSAAAWIVLADFAPPLTTTARSMLKLAIILTVVLAPVGLAIKLLNRGRTGPVLANLVIVAQVVMSLAMLVGWFALVLPSEPARTDFPLLRDGMGQNTAAHSVMCGSLERRAETLRLTRETITRTKPTIADLRVTLSYLRDGPPSSMAEMDARISHGEMVADKLPDAIAFASYNIHRTAQLRSETDTAERDFLRAYPHAVYSSGFVLFALGALLLWLILLSWKLVVWPAPRWRGKLIAVSGLLAGWAGAAVIALTLGWWFTPQPLPEILVDMDGWTAAEITSDLESLERHLEVVEAATALEINRLRRTNRELQGFCPTVNNFGLWQVSGQTHGG